MRHTCNRKERNRAFSLVEVIMACVLITLCAAMGAIKFKESYDDRQAKSSIQQLERKFQLASLLAQLTRGAVTVMIEGQERPQFYIRDDVNVIAKKKQFFSRRETLEKIQRVVLDPPDSTQQHHCIEITFYPWGIAEEEHSLQIEFVTGASITLPLKKYAPQVRLMAPEEIGKIFPETVFNKE